MNPETLFETPTVGSYWKVRPGCTLTGPHPYPDSFIVEALYTDPEGMIMGIFVDGILYHDSMTLFHVYAYYYEVKDEDELGWELLKHVP